MAATSESEANAFCANFDATPYELVADGSAAEAWTCGGGELAFGISQLWPTSKVDPVLRDFAGASKSDPDSWYPQLLSRCLVAYAKGLVSSSTFEFLRHGSFRHPACLADFALLAKGGKGNPVLDCKMDVLSRLGHFYQGTTSEDVADSWEDEGDDDAQFSLKDVKVY